MFKSKSFAYVIFSLALLYIASPWIVEKKLFFNEILSLSGFLILAANRFAVNRGAINNCIIILLVWCGLHLITSLFLMDGVYYYLRTSVIVYSIFSYFIGYFLFEQLGRFIQTILPYLRVYLIVFLFVNVPVLFERYGMAMLFPAIFKNIITRNTLLLLALINVIYSFTYPSATSILVAGIYLVLYLSPSFKVFSRIIGLSTILAVTLFVYFLPVLSLADGYTPENEEGVRNVIAAHPILSLDPNTTWRLIFWKQVLIDHFPRNLIGLGFGTPMITYFPVEDPEKLHTLPYVFGAHNSFVHLFGRLGLPYLLITGYLYFYIMKDYFKNKAYYIRNNSILLFWSFLAISMIALFNPVLETPIFSSAYWMILGFVAAAIERRKINNAHV
ncbi:MAG TPA: O-antigen ligase family protein [Parasegetibacter sp.]